MTATAAERLAGLLCHHDGDDAGHELAPSCPVQVKPSNDSLVTWPACSNGTALYGFIYRTSPARGTCPECGRTDVKITLRTVRTSLNDTHDYMRGVKLADVPQLAAHKRPGRRAPACPGPPLGVWPGPTRYRIPAVEAMLRDHGTDAVA